MDSTDTINDLKAVLRREVSTFCSSDSVAWRLPARQALWRMHESGWKAVLFGGTLRSLLWSRLYQNRPGRPRDIDVVVRDVQLDALRHSFEHILRETRFGGLKVQEKDWMFDVWPLDRTWMFLHDRAMQPSFDQLPHTTAFNIEAIAVEIWPEKGHSRMIFSGDDQFFKGIANKVIELNRPENPFPELTVIRALLLAQNLGFDLGQRLAKYVSNFGPGISLADFQSIQIKHYGVVREDAETLRESVDRVRRSLDSGVNEAIKVPTVKQLTFFDEDKYRPFRMRAYALEQ